MVPLLIKKYEQYPVLQFRYHFSFNSLAVTARAGVLNVRYATSVKTGSSGGSVFRTHFPALFFLIDIL